MPDETLLHEYSPTLGDLRLAPHPRVDRRILAAHQSGAPVSIKIQVTTRRLLVHLNSSMLQQAISVEFDEVSAIVASSGWLDPNYGVALHDRNGQIFHVGSTRPHVVAVDLWLRLAMALICTLGMQGRIREAFSTLSLIDISTLATPDDYYSMRKEIIDLSIGLGFSFPINSSPCIDSHILFSSVDAWVQSQLSSQPAQLNQSATSVKQMDVEYINNKGNSKTVAEIYVPALSLGGGPSVLMAWLVDFETYVRESQPIVSISTEDRRSPTVLCANHSGIIYHTKKSGDILSVGSCIGSILLCDDPASGPLKPVSNALALDVQSRTTANAIQQGTLQIASGSIPQFTPSSACEPAGFSPRETEEADLIYALANSKTSFQTFCNDLNVISPCGIDDDVVSIPSFDEALYCALVREMHRYSLAEIADNQSELAKKNAGLGAMVGSLLGLISGNIFAPFLGHAYGKNNSDRGKRVEEYLPDPNLLFYQDENSYLSWSKAQVVSPRLRRLILDRRVKSDGNIFFRIVPAIVTADSVFPIQLFKVDSSTYFYRPFSAGIERNQANYDAKKIQRKYFHIRNEGVMHRTEIPIDIFGRDIEEKYPSLFYRFKGQGLDYFYIDFKLQPGSVF